MSIWGYLRSRAILLILFVVAIALIAATLAADDAASPGTAPYALGCGALVLAIAVWADYLRLKRRCRLLDQMIGSGQEPVSLPPALDEAERRYQKLLMDTVRRGRAALLSAQQQAAENADFMSAWVHEVKTPITAMRLLLESDVLDGQDVLSLREEVSRVESDVEKVLFNARGDAFHQDYLLAEEALHPLVRGCIKRHAGLFIRKGIRVIDRVDDGITVYTDRKWLDFILDQLMSNALKYTPKGGVITLDARQDAKQAVLTIRDTGCGIRGEDMPRLFGKSFTGHNGRVGGGAGRATGFGLYLSQKLARKLGHRVTLDSVWGEGTSARIIFPALQDYFQPDLGETGQ